MHFAYPDGHVALEDFTLAIEPGQRVAFVGRSGAGKSTVFNLLPRLYDPTAGRILLDGHDLRALTLGLAPRPDRRRQPGVGAPLRHASRRTSASAAATRRRAEIEAAGRGRRRRRLHPRAAAGLRHPGRALRRQFSGGERQRLSIARAILRDAPILLLDEPTSALDAESEALIRGALDRLARGRTTLVIAHRLATVLDSDLIVVMDRGRIVEQGTHAELLARQGLYADLYQLQFAGRRPLPRAAAKAICAGER